MPHYTTYGGSYLSAQSVDELTGTFNALNETTNFRPTKGASISTVHPTFKTGYDTDSIDSLSETFGDGDPRILGPISGEGVFKSQDIDAKGSVIVGDNHFTPDRGGDSLTGEGRPMNVWINGSATSFEDSNWIWQDCNDVKSDQHNNDAVFGMRENIDWTAANGGPGSSYLAAKTASKTNAYVDEDVDGFMKLGDIKGELQTTDLRSDNSFVIERFEPSAEMNSFRESLNPVVELGGTSGPGGSTFMAEKTGANPGQMLSPLSGGDGCAF